MQIKIFILAMLFPVVNSIGFPQASDHQNKGKQYPSKYKEGIVVDGNSSEWDISMFNFNKQAQVNYSIVNDTSAFYICVRIADEHAQMKVLRNGIEVRFNSKGKKKAEATLHYPIGSKMDMGGRMNPENSHGKKMMHAMFLLQMPDMELTGFKNGINGFQNIKSGKNGILAAVNWDSTDVMVYETRIPLSAFNTDVKESNPLAVGIIIKGAPKPKPEDNDAGMQNQGQGGMQGQGRPGGMNQNGMGNGSMQGYGDMRIFEDDEIWQSIVVAKKEKK